VDTLIELLQISAQRFADRPALLIKPGFRTKKWTYRDLGEVVPRVATYLAGAGVRPGDRVIIWAVNRPEWGIAFFGALHAGAVLVPLDFRFMPDFAQKVVERTRASFVLASQQTVDAARSLGLPMQTIEDLPELARQCESLQPPAVGPNDLVEVMFTSGTTGEPKGAMLSHRNIVANAESVLQVFPVAPKERLLSIIPLSHMFEQNVGFITPLLAGASIAYPTSLQPAVLARALRDFGTSIFLFVPQGLRLLNNAIERRVDAEGKRAAFERLHGWARSLPMALRRLLFFRVHRQFGGRLRTIGVGGAALDPELGRRWEEMGIEILQGYGLTECGPVLTFNPPGQNRMGTVGRAIPGVEVRIADDGEVLARGPNVFRGYWENEEATRASFVDGWYRTGDLGQLDADGYLTLRGRKKDMLALPDGTKVYPEDLESLLSHDPRVKDAAVVGLERPGQPLHVHAVLLLHDAAYADAVVRDANARLQSHQQIRGHTVWPDDDFPRTHTLKVKKRLVLERLQAQEMAPAERQASSAPQTDVERIVSQVAKVPVGMVLPNARLSSDLRMDSLSRVELLGVIEEELGAYIDDATFDPDTTVVQLQKIVDEKRGERQQRGIFGWPMHPLIRALGLSIQEVLMRPFVALLYRVRVRGLEHLRGLRGPVMFTPNHHLHLDNAIILCSIPLGWRWKLSVAAAADDVFGNPLRGIGAAVIGNAFPLARDGGIRRSLELLGARLDRDFSVLIYPEGKLTVGGPLQPFKSGAGLIAVEGGTPVVPMKLKIMKMSIWDRIGWPIRGDVELVFGKPLSFASRTDATEATNRIEAAVAAL
jgi:long-chain acyl-CoA synthetase